MVKIKYGSFGAFWMAVLGYINVVMGAYFLVFPLVLRLDPIDALVRILVFLLYLASSNAIMVYANRFTGIKFLRRFGIKYAIGFNIVSAFLVMFGTVYPRGVKPMLGWFMVSYAIALLLFWGLTSRRGPFEKDT